MSPAPGVTHAEFLGNEPQFNQIVYDAVTQYRGSISADHGLGQLKPAENEHYKAPLEIALMRRLKAAFDPLGIMNPGKVLAP